MGRRATAIGECGQNAARYVILGSLTVETGNETMDQVFLFLPFGHAKRGDTYLIADFSKLADIWLASVSICLGTARPQPLVTAWYNWLNDGYGLPRRQGSPLLFVERGPLNAVWRVIPAPGFEDRFEATSRDWLDGNGAGAAVEGEVEAVHGFHVLRAFPSRRSWAMCACSSR